MSQDWIKVCKETPDKPETRAIARTCKITPEVAFTKLFQLWAWADSHTTDGLAKFTCTDDVDARVSVAGFAQAMVSVGWLEVVSDGILFPKFDRHMGESAKKRALESKRKKGLRRRQRGRKMSAKCPQDVREMSAETRTKSGPEKEKEKEKEKDKRKNKKKKTPDRDDTSSSASPTRVANPLFDALAEVTGTSPVTNGGLLGSVAALLAKEEPPFSADEVREFAARFWEFCPYAAKDNRSRPTPKEIEKNIGMVRAGPAPVLLNIAEQQLNNQFSSFVSRDQA